MARRFTGFRRRNRGFALRPVDSVTNRVYDQEAVVPAGVTTIIARAVDNPTTAVDRDVKRASTIKAIWLSLDMCGLGTTGGLQNTSAYLIKNPGANLTPPLVRTEGTSNEKKFIIKAWDYMTMRNQDGNPPYHWEGWIPVPQRYQRMGTDDLWQIQWGCTTATSHGSVMAIYKWLS